MAKRHKKGSGGDKEKARNRGRLRLLKLLAGIALGSGIALILDKLWWKYVAPLYDNPLDHYSLGILLIIAGVLIYKLAITRYRHDRGKGYSDR